MRQNPWRVFETAGFDATCRNPGTRRRCTRAIGRARSIASPGVNPANVYRSEMNLEILPAHPKYPIFRSWDVFKFMFHPVGPFGGGVGPRSVPFDFVGPRVTDLDEFMPVDFPDLE